MGELTDLVNELLAQVDLTTCGYLEEERDRFPERDRLVARYDLVKETWRVGDPRETRGVTEVINELTLAKCILEATQNPCVHMEYEPPIEGIQKTIDFAAELEDGSRVYFDVKTIHPEDRDSWRRYERIREGGLLSDGTDVVLRSDFMGGELAHYMLASRQRFLEYTLELEAKIAGGRNFGDARFSMVFCGDGFRWSVDELEDFADFYHSGRHRQDDPFGAMEAHYIQERGISVARTVQDFCYLERKQRRVAPTKFRCGVQGPVLFS